MTTQSSQLSDAPVWRDRAQWREATLLLESVFRSGRNGLTAVADLAVDLGKEMEVLSPYIQEQTASACPSCARVCCINLHGYYDVHDLIYVCALGLTPPAYEEGVDDYDPCRFLSLDGCSRKRSARPFRCNWYFCRSLTEQMENGPARPYRRFLNGFREVVDLRRKMLEQFSRILDMHATHEERFASLYMKSVKS